MVLDAFCEIDDENEPRAESYIKGKIGNAEESVGLSRASRDICESASMQEMV